MSEFRIPILYLWHCFYQLNFHKPWLGLGNSVSCFDDFLMGLRPQMDVTWCLSSSNKEEDRQLILFVSSSFPPHSLPPSLCVCVCVCMYVCVHACMLSFVQLFATDLMDCSLPDSSVHGIPRQEYWSGLPFPSPGYLPNPGSKPPSLESPALAGRFPSTLLDSGNIFEL